MAMSSSSIYRDLHAMTYSFLGSQKPQSKNNYNSTIFGSKNEVRSNFIRQKLMEFLLFNEVLENSFFFPITDQ